MSQPLEAWLESIKQLRKLSWPALQQGPFLRDPIRKMVIDPSAFFTPADGTIVYQEVVDGDTEIIPVKGQQYTLNDLMEKEFDRKCLVIGIFMTTFDVHVNRIPYGGMLKYKYLTPIVSYNKPMLFTENDILKDKLGDLFDDIGIYLRYNARMINEVYVPEIDYRYYVTQIADDEVNVITPFSTQQNRWFHQNERFSFVRWGSQVELVLPIDDRFRFEPLIPLYHHVKASHDAIVKLHQ